MPEADLTGERLAAIADAQKRTRVALWITALVCCAILGVLWNAYFSWDRQWADLNPTHPENWGRRILIEERIRAWQDSYDINVGLLGIHVIGGDAAFLGSLVLLVLSYWIFLTLRDTNSEVGSFLISKANAEDAERERIHVSIRTGMVLESTRFAEPIRSLSDTPAEKPCAKSPSGPYKLLLFVPFITVLLIIASDLYFGFSGYISPFRGNRGGAFFDLPLIYKVTFVIGDLIAAACAIFMWRILTRAADYHGATADIVREFGLRKKRAPSSPAPGK